MQAPLANVITLGALDLARLRAFYGALGWLVLTVSGGPTRTAITGPTPRGLPFRGW